MPLLREWQWIGVFLLVRRHQQPLTRSYQKERKKKSLDSHQTCRATSQGMLFMVQKLAVHPLARLSKLSVYDPRVDSREGRWILLPLERFTAEPFGRAPHIWKGCHTSGGPHALRPRSSESLRWDPIRRFTSTLGFLWCKATRSLSTATFCDAPLLSPPSKLTVIWDLMIPWLLSETYIIYFVRLTKLFNWPSTRPTCSLRLVHAR